MKKIIIPFLILLIIILILFFVFTMKKRVNIKNIQHLRFSYTSGYAMYAYTIYEIDYKDGKYFLTTKPDGVPDEDKQTEEIKKEDIKAIENILNKYSVCFWDGFNKTDKNVLDGNSFSFTLTFDNNNEIHSYGYMMYPKNYREVKEELINIFIKYYKDKE